MFHFKQSSFPPIQKQLSEDTASKQNLTVKEAVGQTVRSWSQAGEVRPIICSQLETFGKCKTSHKIHSLKSQINLKNLVSRWVENVRKQ